MSGLLRSEWLRVRRRRLPWILGAVIGAVIGALYLLLAIAVTAAGEGQAVASADWEADLALRNTVRFGDAIVYRVVAVATVVLAAVTTAGEYRWRTAELQAAWTGERIRPAAAKVLLLGALTLSGLLVGYIALVSASVAVNAVRTTSSGEAGLWLALDGAIGALRTVPALLAFLVLAWAIAGLTRSSAAAIGVALAVLFLEPFGAALLVAAGGPMEEVARLTLSRNVDALLAANGAVVGSSETIPGGLPSPWAGAASLVAFAAATFAWVAHVDSRREFSG